MAVTALGTTDRWAASAPRGSRVLLPVVALRLMIGEIEEDLDDQTAWDSFGAGIDVDGWAFAAQFGVLAAAYAVFELAPTAAISLWVPERSRETATSVVIAIKNPTVIAMTILWLVGVARSFMCLGASQLNDEAGSPR